MTGSSATDTTEPVDPADDFDHDPGTSPSHIGDPRLRFEFARALIWCLVIGLVALAVYLSHSLLVIFGAMVFGCLIDAGARGLERILPVGRGIRVAIVLLLSVGFLIWLVSSLGNTDCHTGGGISRHHPGTGQPPDRGTAAARLFLPHPRCRHHRIRHGQQRGHGHPRNRRHRWRADNDVPDCRNRHLLRH